MNYRKTISIFLYLSLLLITPALYSQDGVAPNRVQITILGTTDLHGNIDPVDYYTNKPDNRGLAKISTSGNGETALPACSTKPLSPRMRRRG